MVNGNLTTNPDVNIRAARREDGEVIGRYGAELMALHHAWDPKRFIAPDSSTPGKYARYLASQIGRREVVVLVAEAAGLVIGYCYGANEGPDYMALRGPAGVVHDIFVDEMSRGCGVGLRLLQAVIASLTELGAVQMVLSTAYRNEPGQRLFAAAGFRTTMMEMALQLDAT
jgi:L-amino acid N-acyltransferase YncA